MQNSNKVQKSLFDNILEQEQISAIDAKCQLYANRVGLVMKILYSRPDELRNIRNAFEDELSVLIRKTCNSIDNELHKTPKVEKSEV